MAITSKVHIDNARELLKRLKKEGFIVKNNKISEDFKVGDVIEVVHPMAFSIKVIGG